MLLIGLTGGIAAGKSTAAGRLRTLGAQVIDADVLAREALGPGSPGLVEVARVFGAGVVVDGSLDRAALARIVFADPAARARLEAIVHPVVQARSAALVRTAAPGAVVVHDVPLLVENGLAPRYHLVVVVHADQAVRVERLVRERAMSGSDARARVAAQADDVQRRSVADVWLDNSGATDALLDSVDEVWRARLVPYEDNLRRHRRTRRPDRVRLLPHDPQWSAQAARTAARISWAIREHPAAAVCRVEHVGSTAVAGLAAKDVLDLQLAVPSLAVADELQPALDAAGWVRVAGNDGDTPKPYEPDPARWAKRFYGGTDPAVVVHLHVRSTGSAGWRFCLLFRDWLRADAGARRDYEAEKRRVAAAAADADAYALAKEPWFDVAVPRAIAWAGRTGWAPSG